jgi:hypothetical protein
LYWPKVSADAGVAVATDIVTRIAPATAVPIALFRFHMSCAFREHWSAGASAGRGCDRAFAITLISGSRGGNGGHDDGAVQSAEETWQGRCR